MRLGVVCFVTILVLIIVTSILFGVVWLLGGQVAAFQALGAMLLGTIVTGIFVAISMTSGGGAWDNAKKFIETGVHGGKGSDTHKAAVVGDTVGDPMKDTSGPSLNILMKLMAIISLVFAPFIISAHQSIAALFGF